ncbi:MAG: prepilin-type N-terminal cleavage/methylation domain-containing protein [Patescibacteria group bacterium]
MKRNGFSLVELLIYMGVLAITATLFLGILASTARIQVHEVAASELTNQLNFSLQTIQRLVRESSNIAGVGAGDNSETGTVELSYLKLRMPDDTQDPTCITLVNNAGVNEIRVTQGGQIIPNEYKCKDSVPLDAITTNKVTVSNLGFTFSPGAGAPAKDIVEIALTMDSNTQNPQGQISRSLRSAIGRVSAATFDTGVVPTITDTLDLGSQSTLWSNLWVKNIRGEFKQPNNYGGTLTKGNFVVGIPQGTSCNTLCSNHVNSCAFAFEFVDPNPPTSNDRALDELTCSTNAGAYGGICFCR